MLMYCDSALQSTTVYEGSTVLSCQFIIVCQLFLKYLGFYRATVTNRGTDLVDAATLVLRLTRLRETSGWLRQSLRSTSKPCWSPVRP